MQKSDPLREQAQARASAQAPNQTLARLKARSLGKPMPAAARPRAAAVEVPETIQGSSPKPLVR